MILPSVTTLAPATPAEAWKFPAGCPVVSVVHLPDSASGKTPRCAVKLWRCPSCGTANDATRHRCEKSHTRVEFLGSTDDDLTPAEREARRDRGAGKTVLGVFGILALLQIVLFAFAGITVQALTTCILASGIVFVGVYAVTSASTGVTGSVARLLVGLLCTLAAILGLIIIFAVTCASSFSLGGLH